MRIEDLEHCERLEDGKRMMVSELRDNAIILRMFVKVGGRWKANETMLVTRAMFDFVREQIGKMEAPPNKRLHSTGASGAIDNQTRDTRASG